MRSRGRAGRRIQWRRALEYHPRRGQRAAERQALTSGGSRGQHGKHYSAPARKNYLRCAKCGQVRSVKPNQKLFFGLVAEQAPLLSIEPPFFHSTLLGRGVSQAGGFKGGRLRPRGAACGHVARAPKMGCKLALARAHAGKACGCCPHWSARAHAADRVSGRGRARGAAGELKELALARVHAGKACGC